MTSLKLLVLHEKWPIAGSFTISRGAKTHADVVVVELSDGRHSGRGECVPYGRYGETVESVLGEIMGLEQALLTGLDREALQSAIGPGAARNALDCAFFDLHAKRSGRPAHEIAGLTPPRPLLTAYTISLGTPKAMAEAAKKANAFALLKLKLGGAGDPARMQAVRAARPDARLIADANEAWTPDNCSALLASAHECGFELIEQPLPADNDGVLADIERVVAVCADESMHDRADLGGLKDRYDVVNIKLDKTGGFREAHQCVELARAAGFRIMLGCMVSTSLAIAPALLLGGMADWVDLDGPLLLAEDRFGGITQLNGMISPAGVDIWG